MGVSSSGISAVIEVINNLTLLIAHTRYLPIFHPPCTNTDLG